MSLPYIHRPFLKPYYHDFSYLFLYISTPKNHHNEI